MLTLSVPGIAPAISRTVEPRPKPVSAWLANLPFASPMESAQQLVTALYAFNRSPLALAVAPSPVSDRDGRRGQA